MSPSESPPLRTVVTYDSGANGLRLRATVMWYKGVRLEAVAGGSKSMVSDVQVVNV